MNKKENIKNLVKRMFLSISMMSFFVSAGIENVNAMNESIFEAIKKGRADNKSRRNAVPVPASMTTLAAKQDNSGYRLAVPDSPTLDPKTGVGGGSLIFEQGLNKDSGFSEDTIFVSVIITNATNKLNLFRELKNISKKSKKDLADKYISLYGDNELTMETRKKTLASIMPFKKTIIGAAEYVVKALFGQAKRELYEVGTLDECIRVATLLLADAPELASSSPMNNIEDMLQAAILMRTTRIENNKQIQSIINALPFVQ